MAGITVIGGGLAGLVAAISAAEQGGRVTLHEKQATLGGRGRTNAGPYKTNIGPHALYTGSLTEWLKQRDLLPPTIPPKDGAFTMVWRGERQSFPPVFESVMRALPLTAPDDRNYRDWATEHMGEPGAEAAVGFLSLPTYHANPGELSAAFAHERLQRAFQPGGFCYVRGGWTALVASLELRARQLGVVIETQSTVTALPPSPTIVATELPTAARILANAGLRWTSARSALFDLAVRSDDADPVAVLDLDQRVYVARYTAYDSDLAPAGEELIQCSAGIRDGETLSDAIARIHGVLDRNYPSWRVRMTWSQQSPYLGVAPVDHPGTSWRDRPAIEQGDGVWLAGDHVAAPGLLAEVAFASAITAAAAAVRSSSGARASLYV